VLDRVPPQTGIRNPPPRLSTSRLQIVDFAVLAEYGAGSVEFSYSINGSAWSSWSPESEWLGSNLPDGVYHFKVRSRDWLGEVDSIGSSATFEIDATPPMPVIESPAYGQAVRDSILIRGTAADLRFRKYGVEIRSSGAGAWEHLTESSSPVTDGALCTWNTLALPDGDYELRLSVADTLDLTGTALVKVIVDNHEPWANVTAPAAVSASSGGDVYTTNCEIHLYFAPHTFDETAVVVIDPASLQDDLPEDAELVHPGYEIYWEGRELRKPATLEMALGDGAARVEPGEVLALYVLPEGQEWRRLGGTVNHDEETILAAIDCEGTYCLFTDSGGPGPGGGLSPISFAPRVFSPRGSFGNTQVAISFTLGRAGPVTVKIYNRAGRLVDEIVESKHMNAGANVLRWDGRDSGGDEVPDGLYLVTVEAMGQTRAKTLGVVR
jgi:hypothetical protein